MLFFYKNLPIATKLFLSNLAFALPVVVLIFFMNISLPTTSIGTLIHDTREHLFLGRDNDWQGQVGSFHI